MLANILTAVINIVEERQYDLKETYIRTNRANSMGDALEKYVIDSFANTFLETNEIDRMERIQEIFSYIGNDSNPPDAMLREGAAIETKKIERRNATLQLNSSTPKSKLYISDSKLTKKAKEAEEWEEKDFIYAVGFVDGKLKKLKELSLIDAEIYCADNNMYEDISQKIKDGISSIEDIDFHETRELGRVNEVDLKKITNFRIRGMWILENPFKVFSEVYSPKEEAEFNLFAIVPKEKCKQFKNYSYLKSLEKKVNTLNVEDICVPSPNNIKQSIECIKITFYI